MFTTYLWVQRGRLDLERLNLDGTHSLVKRSAESSAYQHRKRGKTSNLLVMTDVRGIPVACGGILSGNHNGLYDVVAQYRAMVRHLRECGTCLDNSIQNTDKGFDSKSLRRAIQRRKIIPNSKENIRNRKKPKAGRKRH